MAEPAPAANVLHDASAPAAGFRAAPVAAAAPPAAAAAAPTEVSAAFAWNDTNAAPATHALHNDAAPAAGFRSAAPAAGFRSSAPAHAAAEISSEISSAFAWDSSTAGPAKHALHNDAAPAAGFRSAAPAAGFRSEAPAVTTEVSGAFSWDDSSNSSNDAPQRTTMHDTSAPAAGQMRRRGGPAAGPVRRAATNPNPFVWDEPAEPKAKRARGAHSVVFSSEPAEVTSMEAAGRPTARGAIDDAPPPAPPPPVIVEEPAAAPPPSAPRPILATTPARKPVLVATPARTPGRRTVQATPVSRARPGLSRGGSDGIDLVVRSMPSMVAPLTLPPPIVDTAAAAAARAILSTLLAPCSRAVTAMSEGTGFVSEKHVRSALMSAGVPPLTISSVVTPLTASLHAGGTLEETLMAIAALGPSADESSTTSNDDNVKVSVEESAALVRPSTPLAVPTTAAGKDAAIAEAAKALAHANRVLAVAIAAAAAIESAAAAIESAGVYAPADAMAFASKVNAHGASILLPFSEEELARGRDSEGSDVFASCRYSEGSEVSSPLVRHDDAMVTARDKAPIQQMHAVPQEVQVAAQEAIEESNEAEAMEEEEEEVHRGWTPPSRPANPKALAPSAETNRQRPAPAVLTFSPFGKAKPAGTKPPAKQPGALIRQPKGKMGNKAFAWTTDGCMSPSMAQKEANAVSDAREAKVRAREEAKRARAASKARSHAWVV